MHMHKSRYAPIAIIPLLVLIVTAGAAWADPCLVVYPTGPCIYHYDTDEYYTVGPGHPLYDPAYDRGGDVLLETGSNEIDGSIYQAPGLAGFEPSTDGNDGYVFIGTEFDLVVDGFANAPTTYVNVLVVFDKVVPAGCEPQILVDGAPIAAYVYPLGDLVVSTPTPEGGHFSDTFVLDVSWRGCYGIHVWAFSDENGNGVRDGGECFTAFSHDLVVPARDATWSEIKQAGGE